MATPHVAGLVAYLISVNGNVSPATMSTNIKNLATKNALTGLRTSPSIRLECFMETKKSSASGTVNYLAYNGQ